MDMYVRTTSGHVQKLTLSSAHSHLRRNAFGKLAALSARPSSQNETGSLARLDAALPKVDDEPTGYLDGMLRALAPTSRVPMSIRELEVLLALCQTAPAISNLAHAEALVGRLKSYLPAAHIQKFVPSPFLQEISPSPWEVITYQLTHALLSIGIRHMSLKANIAGIIDAYLSNVSKAYSAWTAATGNDPDRPQDVAEMAAITVSLLGFIDAAAVHENFWTSVERLALIRSLRTLFSEEFFVAVESSFSTIRGPRPHPQLRDWRRSFRRYAARGTPLGATSLQQGFMKLVLACTSRLLCDEDNVESGDLLDQYIAGVHLSRAHGQEVTEDMIEYLVEVITDQMRLLEEGADYLQLGSIWQQRLAFSLKAYTLEAFLHCMVLDEDFADADVMFSWLEDAISNEEQMADQDLANVVLKSLAVVAKYLPDSTSNFARLLLRFIVRGTSQESMVTMAGQSLSHILRMLSQDAVITTLYSLGNVLSSQSGAEKPHQTVSPSPEPNGHHNSLASAGRLRTGSVISLSMSGDEETSIVCGNVAHAIVVVANTCEDSKIIALAQTMMLQKVGRINLAVDARIIEEAAVLAVHGRENEFRALLRFYTRLHEDAVKEQTSVIFDAVRNAREHLAQSLDPTSPLFRIFAIQLLERIISKGDIVEGEFKQSAEVEQAAQEIAPLLKPLSILAARKTWLNAESSIEDDDEVNLLIREAWFNIAVHGVTLQSRIGQQYYHELRTMAMHSPPLVDDDRAELLESDVELNTILRRGMSTSHVAEQRRCLSVAIPSREAEIRQLSYQKVVFLNTVFLVESLRAVSGSCAEILSYFADPTVRSSDMGTCLTSIAEESIRAYLGKVLPAQEDDFAATYVSRQLAKIFTGCCHRSLKVQDIAVEAGEAIIASAPSALCQKSSIFALLELLSLMWSSCLEADIDEYEWQSTFTSARGKVTIELSDDYAYRKRTLNRLHSNARRWMAGVVGLAPLDVKGLLQTYLSEYDDTGAYGHVSLGRSFALEIGSLIPPYDQRLGAINRRGEDASVNVASDFMAQYTTRQEYRYAGIADHDQEWIDFMHLRSKPSTSASVPHKADDIAAEAQVMLSELERRTREAKFVSTSEIKDVLRRAAALLCGSKRSQTEICRHLVNIPFQVFTKESIKLGISLWLGVIHENPRMEPRILTEVALAWERTIDRRLGIFNSAFSLTDPFYVKSEFAPSDRASLMKQAQTAQSTISPHLRIIQFFESHFNSSRLGSVNTQKTFLRVITRTFLGFQKSQGHPLTREIHMHCVLFGARFLRFSTCLTKTFYWRLRDGMVSTGLQWFKNAPAWSFGGNRLQMKAELQVMRDILSAFQYLERSDQKVTNSRQNISQKQTLLQMLLEAEISRVLVWLNPSDLGAGLPGTNTPIQTLIRTAWAQDPGIAIHLPKRFANEQISNEVRFLLINFPTKALQYADALALLLGSVLSHDLSFQLKYLLYWAPVNPMQAVTYFTPSFENNPYVIQYSMRALESHSVDVTFFYVPQIVQALRYDSLGYVRRYIVETGTFSQLFAHQIIWNMKANAYKDEDSEVADSLKPTLDKVMDSLVASFSGNDKDFYEREFAFFGKVTDISGKLKPFIKKTKPEKKAKIEEELRKIKVEIGVYLPSNPDGVVVGIDRKSGKPLQSHAKAPYMATFRIRKTLNAPIETVKVVVENAPKPEATRPKLLFRNTTAHSTIPLMEDENPEPSYEVWQSAIFKVGDDCRQDVLALQLVAAFRGIFNSVGLDVYVFPYRVTATAPGCGVIDVLPNSISRDMLGREAVNGLHDYFLTKYGGEHSIRYQEARTEFVKSMAAYSVISYLLQFKDRHNGNIMVDDKGHILHIDFGFLFDIAPGGVKFERAPFKLTSEMVAVMGGSGPEKSQAWRWFEELTIKAFLASRPYCDQLCHLVQLMLDSGLPCFKPNTMKNLRDRFMLQKSEREAAAFMQTCIRKSAGNVSTMVYDEFQLLTNGIPY